ncbi:hypothetical protein ACS0TY_020211 [Phlomoides rotata]
MKMEERLYKATTEGNTKSLQNLLKQDTLILDRINTTTTSYLETPLHIAAMLGHEKFVAELLKIKPALARELDSTRSSPLHLGSAKGHVVIVKALLRAYPDACLARDRDGRNPVHVAAMMGRVDVLRELLEVKPEAARVVMTHGGGIGTVLHLCVEYNQFEALKVVMESVDFKDLVNNKDKYGNTVLHLAVADKQVETTEFLLSVPRMDLNAVNHSGFTAIDILIQRRRDARDLQMEETLKQAGAIAHNKTPFSPRIKHKPADPRSSSNKKQRINNQDDWLDKKRSALMVVASLIATMAFQVGVNPPPKIWDESPSNSTNDPVKPIYYVRKASEFMKKGERFYIINTVSFIASLSIILLLMSGLPLKSRFFVWILLLITWIAITGIALSYTVAVVLLTPPSKEKEINAVVGVTVSAWICVMALLAVGHTIRLVVWMLKLVFKLVKLIFKLVKLAIKSLFLIRRNSPVHGVNTSRV